MYGLTEAKYAIWRAMLIAEAQQLELEERCRASGNLAEIDKRSEERIKRVVEGVKNQQQSGAEKKPALTKESTWQSETSTEEPLFPPIDDKDIPFPPEEDEQGISTEDIPF